MVIVKVNFCYEFCYLKIVAYLFKIFEYSKYAEFHWPKFNF